MGKAITLKTIYSAVDKFSAPLKKMAAASRGFGAKVATSMGKAERAIRRLNAPMNKVTRKFGGMAALAGGLTLGIAVSQGAQAVVEFDKSLSAASAKFGVFDRSSKAFTQLKDTAANIGATTEFTAGQAAQGLDFLAMAGFTAEQAMSALPGVVDLATAAQMDLSTATDIASDSLGAFNLMSKDSAQLQKNLARVNDVFAKTTSTANTNMEQMFESMKDGGPVATAAGASVETFATLTGELANAGIKGSKAGTTLKNMFTKLQAPTAGAAKMLTKLGVQTVDSSGNMRDIIDILGDLDNATKKLGSAEKTQIMDELFGARAIAGANVLLNAGADKLRNYRTELEGSAGASAKMAAHMRGGLSGIIASMKSAFESIAITIGEQFRPEIDAAIKSITGGARGAAKWMKEHKPFIKLLLKIGKAFLIYAVAVKSLSLIMTIYNNIQKVATVLQTVFNAVMAANPIALIILAVIALIAAIVLMVKHWDNVKAAVSRFVDGVINSFNKLMKPFGWIKDAIAAVRERWDAITQAFKGGGILAGLKSIFKAILSFLFTPIEGFLKLISKIPGVKKLIQPALNKIQEVRNSLNDAEEETKKTEETKPVNIAATQTNVEEKRLEEIKKQQVAIEINNAAQGTETDVKSNPGAVPVTTNTY